MTTFLSDSEHPHDVKAPPKSARRRAREFVLQGLYQWRVGGADLQGEAKARFAQIQRDLAVAIHASAGQPEVLDQAEQPLILALAQAGRLPKPGVVAAPVHAEHPAHRDQPKLTNMRMHERVLRPYPLAKYAAAFFKISRSSVVRFSSAFKRAISAFNAATLSLADEDCLPLLCRIQR